MIPTERCDRRFIDVFFVFLGPYPSQRNTYLAWCWGDFGFFQTVWLCNHHIVYRTMNTGELNAERTKCCLCNVTLSALMNTEPAVATLQWVIFHWITHYHVASRTRWYVSIIPKYNTWWIITGMGGAKAGLRPPRRSPPCAVYILQGLVHKTILYEHVRCTTQLATLLSCNHSNGCTHSWPFCNF